MAEEVGGDNTQTEHSSVQISEIQTSSSSERRRRASKGVERTWALLQKRKAPRGNECCIATQIAMQCNAMSLVQKIIRLILYAGHSSKLVNIVMSML